MNKSETTFFVDFGGNSPQSLPKSEIKKRLKEGSLSKSQLIWNEELQKWRPAQDFVELKNSAPISIPAGTENKKETMFFLGTTSSEKVESVPRSELQERVAKGNLRKSQMIWEPTEQRWKPSSEFTLPNPGKDTSKKNSRKTKLSRKMSRKNSRAGKMQAAADNPQVLLGKRRRMATTFLKRELWEIKKHSYYQFIYGAVVAAIIGIIALMNWQVNQSLDSSLNGYSFRNFVKVKAGFKSYAAFRTLVVDISLTPKSMTAEDIIEMLKVLSEATQRNLLLKIVKVVTLTHNDEAQFTFRVEAWRELSRQPTPSLRQKILVDNLYMPDGKLVLSKPSDDFGALQQQRGKVFSEFYKAFVDGDTPPLENLTPSTSSEEKTSSDKKLTVDFPAATKESIKHSMHQ